MKRVFSLCMLLGALCLAVCAHAEEWTLTLHAAGGGSVNVSTQTIGDARWLFLPAFADQSGLALEWLEEADEQGARRALLENGEPVSVMQSQNLRTVFLFSDDPVNEGREYIEGGGKHDRRTTGSIAIVAADGTVEYAGDLRQIRGRGNGTWWNVKKPYQIKLEDKADLLKTGDASEAARTWVLLAENTDPTFMKTKITLDLALEIGMEETSHSEYVDLYYDGEYRGMYVLAEKVEIDEARIDEEDFDKLLETWNKHLGKPSLDVLDVGSAYNRFGKRFTYIKGVEDGGMLSAGAYLLEMESPNGDTLSDRCHFGVDQWDYIALKNPENASEAMVRYVSERLMEARQTLQNGGVNPETGRTIEDDFDVDSFARSLLINELSASLDGYNWSSTFFVLPAGETRFRAGPVWDFDLAWAYRTDGSLQGGAGYKENTGWMVDFYRCEAIGEAMYRIWRQEVEPLIREVLLGEGEGRYLRSLDSYLAQVEAAIRMNDVLWDPVTDYRLVGAEDASSFQDNLTLLRQFIIERTAWLNRTITDVTEKGADVVEIILRIQYGRADEKLDFRLPGWSNAELVDFTCALAQEATETEYGVYEVEAVFAPKEGFAFREPEVYINNQRLKHELLEDGTLRIRFAFSDPSYLRAEYEGEDIGLIFNQEAYLGHYPELRERFGDDREALIAYFCEEGMAQCHQGNAYFTPAAIRLYNPDVEDVLGTDWQSYYWDFLAYGRDEGWLDAQDQRFRPEVTDLL